MRKRMRKKEIVLVCPWRHQQQQQKKIKEVVEEEREGVTDQFVIKCRLSLSYNPPNAMILRRADLMMVISVVVFKKRMKIVLLSFDPMQYVSEGDKLNESRRGDNASLNYKPPPPPPPPPPPAHISILVVIIGKAMESTYEETICLPQL